MRTERLGLLAIATVAAGTLAGGPGCSEPSPDEIHAADFGYTSIRQLQIDVRHTESGLRVGLVAELVMSEGATCPPLDPDFAITANGVAPESMGLDPNGGDAVVLFQACRIHQLNAAFTLPTGTHAVRLDLSQRQAGGSIELPIPEQSRMQLGPLSTATVPLGGTFSANVTLSPVPAGRIGNSDCWYGHHCPRENPACTPGHGESGFVIRTSQPSPATIHLDVQVPDGSFTGARAMFLATSSAFDCLTVPLRIDRQAATFTTTASVNVADPLGFGPIDLDVTD